MQKVQQILYVEDNLGDALLLMERFTQNAKDRFQLHHVCSIKDSLDRLSTEQFDAILLDLFLPDSQGLASAERILKAAPEVPLVVLTGLNNENFAIEVLHRGVQDYLVKGMVDVHMVSRALRYAIERHRMTEALRNSSLLDSLTGLYNRRGFSALTEQHMKIAERTGAEIALVFIDIDDMKLINDNYGHLEGDRALQATADLLRCSFRNSDIIGRWGGDEFAVLLNSNNAEIPLLRLRQHLEEQNALRKLPSSLSLSWGLGILGASSKKTTLEDLIKEADMALYARKRRRKQELGFLNLPMMGKSAIRGPSCAQPSSVERLPPGSPIPVVPEQNSIEIEID